MNGNSVHPSPTPRYPVKISALLFVLVLSQALAAAHCRAGELFNAAPPRIESPCDPAHLVLERLGNSPDGKTPVVKKFDLPWTKTLADRGKPKFYDKANSKDFAYIGMPVGGIGAGEVYLAAMPALGVGYIWDALQIGISSRAGRRVCISAYGGRLR